MCLFSRCVFLISVFFLCIHPQEASAQKKCGYKPLKSTDLVYSIRHDDGGTIQCRQTGKKVSPGALNADAAKFKTLSCAVKNKRNKLKLKLGSASSQTAKKIQKKMRRLKQDFKAKKTACQEGPVGPSDPDQVEGENEYGFCWRHVSFIAEYDVVDNPILQSMAIYYDVSPGVVKTRTKVYETINGVDTIVDFYTGSEENDLIQPDELMCLGSSELAELEGALGQIAYLQSCTQMGTGAPFCFAMNPEDPTIGGSIGSESPISGYSLDSYVGMEKILGTNAECFVVETNGIRLRQCTHPLYPVPMKFELGPGAGAAIITSLLVENPAPQDIEPRDSSGALPDLLPYPDVPDKGHCSIWAEAGLDDNNEYLFKDDSVESRVSSTYSIVLEGGVGEHAKLTAGPIDLGVNGRRDFVIGFGQQDQGFLSIKGDRYTYSVSKLHKDTVCNIEFSEFIPPTIGSAGIGQGQFTCLAKRTEIGAPLLGGDSIITTIRGNFQCNWDL